MSVRNFVIPRKIYYGWGALDVLKNLNDSKVFVVTDENMTKCGWVKKVCAILEENTKRKISVFDKVEADPSREIVEKGAKLIEEGTSLVIGLGGGSTIDAAKAMWVFYEHPKLTWEQVFVPFGLPELRKKAQFIAIPSTSGTGTEVNSVAVITNRNVNPNVKNFIKDYEITPDMVILDPAIPSTMPPEVTANTGLDVLVHAVEAYVSTGATDITDPLALKAIELTFKWLPKAVGKGDDKNAREKMHMASSLAGMSFANSGLGITHALAHQLGAEFGLPHGRANAIIFPYVIKFNSLVVAEKYANIAKFLGLEGNSNNILIDCFIKAVNDLKISLSIPLSIKQCGIDEKIFMDKLDMLAENAVKDGTRRANPRESNAKDMRNIYLQAWEGQ